jgi:hypothetical protein
METRKVRQATPERWQRALERALFAGVEAKQLAGSGEWIVSSASRPGPFLVPLMGREGSLAALTVVDGAARHVAFGRTACSMTPAAPRSYPNVVTQSPSDRLGLPARPLRALLGTQPMVIELLSCRFSGTCWPWPRQYPDPEWCGIPRGYGGDWMLLDDDHDGLRCEVEPVINEPGTPSRTDRSTPDRDRRTTSRRERRSSPWRTRTTRSCTLSRCYTHPRRRP